MEPSIKIRILIIIKVLLYTILGLWILFAKGLPPLESTNLLTIFPQIFPILVAAISLFLLPFIRQAFYFYVLLTFDGLVFINALQPFWTESKVPVFIFIILGITSLIALFGGWWIFRQK